MTLRQASPLNDFDPLAGCQAGCALGGNIGLAWLELATISAGALIATTEAIMRHCTRSPMAAVMIRHQIAITDFALHALPVRAAYIHATR